MPEKKALIFRSSALSLSETFIREQIKALSNWKGTLFTFKLVSNGLNLSEISHQKLADTSIANRLRQNLTNSFTGVNSQSLAQVQKFDAKLFHIHFGTDAVKFWPYISNLNVPTLITLHGFDISIYKDEWRKRFLGLSDRHYPDKLLGISKQSNVAFVAVSSSIKSRAIEYGIPEEKLFVRYIGVDTQKFSAVRKIASKTKQRVLFVGRLVEKKGAEVLLEAFSQIQSEFQGAEIEIVGSGPLDTKLKKRARLLGVNAKFLGAIPNEDVQKRMQAARVFCLPSITAKNGDAEGLPIVILEAMASGLPVITSARGGVGEAVIDGKTGFTFQEGNVSQLADCLRVALSNPGLLDGYSVNGLKLVEKKFDLHSCTQELETLYDALYERQAVHNC